MCVSVFFGVEREGGNIAGSQGQQGIFVGQNLSSVACADPSAPVYFVGYYGCSLATQNMSDSTAERTPCTTAGTPWRSMYIVLPADVFLPRSAWWRAPAPAPWQRRHAPAQEICDEAARVGATLQRVRMSCMYTPAILSQLARGQGHAKPPLKLTLQEVEQLNVHSAPAALLALLFSPLEHHTQAFVTATWAACGQPPFPTPRWPTWPNQRAAGATLNHIMHGCPPTPLITSTGSRHQVWETTPDDPCSPGPCS